MFMLQGVEETAKWTTNRIEAIRRLLDETIVRAREQAPSGYSKKLIELLFHQPYCKISVLVDSGIAKRQTASEYLRELENAKILSSEMVGRERIFANTALLRLLTEDSE